MRSNGQIYRLKIFACFEKSSNYRDGGKKSNFVYFLFFCFFCGGQRESFDEQEGGGGLGGTAVGVGGGEGWEFFGALEFLSLTCLPALCSSSFHSNSPLMEELLLQRRWNGWRRRRRQVRGYWGCKGPREGGGGDEIRIC